MEINHAEICRFPVPGILRFFFDVYFSSFSFQVYLEMNAHDHHKLIEERIREYDSQSFSRNANKTST